MVSSFIFFIYISRSILEGPFVLCTRGDLNSPFISVVRSLWHVASLSLKPEYPTGSGLRKPPKKGPPLARKKPRPHSSIVTTFKGPSLGQRNGKQKVYYPRVSTEAEGVRYT